MKNLNIERRVLLLVMLIIVVQCTYFIVKDILNIDEEIKKEIKTAEYIKSSSFNEYINTYKEKGEFFLEGILTNKEAITLFKTKEREKLYSLLKDKYSEMKGSGKIEQFHFHEAPAKSFLRFHKPEKFGDDMSKERKTVLAANSEKREIYGIEVGAGGLGFRVVFPVFDTEKNHIGSVEYCFLQDKFTHYCKENDSVLQNNYSVNESF